MGDLEGVQTSSLILSICCVTPVKNRARGASGGRPNYITVPLPNRMKS